MGGRGRGLREGGTHFGDDLADEEHVEEHGVDDGLDDARLPALGDLDVEGDRDDEGPVHTYKAGREVDQR